MKIAAAYAVAGIVKEGELSPEYILPSIFDERVKTAVSAAVYQAACEDGVSRV